MGKRKTKIKKATLIRHVADALDEVQGRLKQLPSQEYALENAKGHLEVALTLLNRNPRHLRTFVRAKQETTLRIPARGGGMDAMYICEELNNLLDLETEKREKRIESLKRALRKIQVEHPISGRPITKPGKMREARRLIRAIEVLRVPPAGLALAEELASAENELMDAE